MHYSAVVKQVAEVGKLASDTGRLPRFSGQQSRGRSLPAVLSVAGALQEP